MIAASTNSVQRLHGKRRGRPPSEHVREVAQLFPEARSRRGKWNKVYVVRAYGVMRRAGLLDECAIQAGADLPLPMCVCYAIGAISDERLAASLAAEAIELRAAGKRAHDLLEYVRLTCRQLATLTAMQQEPPR